MHDSFGKRESFLPEVTEKFISHLLAKHRSIFPSMKRDEHYALFQKENNVVESELLLVSYGVASRASKDVAVRLMSQRIKAAHLHLPMIWPLHSDMFEAYKNIERVVVVENNSGQLLPFLAPYFPHADIASFVKWNGMPIQTGELTRFCEELIQKEGRWLLNIHNVEKENTADISSGQPQRVFSLESSEEEEDKIVVHKAYPFCSGCGHQSFIDCLLPMLAECGLTNKNTIFVSGIGCGSIVPATFNGHLIKTSHGRALNAARAVKLEYPERMIIVISGDGDLANIGGNHLIHTVRDKKRFPMVCFCLDNANYGMTGGQPSATTPECAATALASLESPPPFDLKRLLYDGLGIDFFARVSVADHAYLSEVMRKAIVASRNTFAFVQVFSHCTTHFVKNNRDLFSRGHLKELQGMWERE